MGIIYNNNVQEKQLYSAYGMVVYGKENDYDWTIYPDRPREKCYISLRINDWKNDIININLGNRCIFKENFDRTIDNFLYWISKDQPFNYDIENTVFKVLTCTDSIFNHRINNRKRKELQEQEQRKRIIKQERKENSASIEISDYCNNKGYIFYRNYEKCFVLNPLMENIKELIEQTMKLNMQLKNQRMKDFIKFVEDHPDNKELHIITSGTLEEVLQHIRK